MYTVYSFEFMCTFTSTKSFTIKILINKTYSAMMIDNDSFYFIYLSTFFFQFPLHANQYKM